MKKLTLIEFLIILANCDANSAADLIEEFQTGKLSIAGFSINDL
jgi:hypothetical protein